MPSKQNDASTRHVAHGCLLLSARPPTAADGSIVRVGRRSRSTTALAFRKADDDGRYTGDHVSCCQGDDVDPG